MADRYCSECGQELGEETRFCPNCGKSVFETGRVATPRAQVPPPPPTPVPVTPAYGGVGGFFRSFGLGAGGCVGCVVAFMLLFGGCAVIGGLAGG